MSFKSKVNIEIKYCVPWGYHGVAAWMVAEFYSVGSGDIAITLTPGDSGVLKVILDDEEIYDKKEENGETPTLARMKELKAIVKAKL